MNCYDYCVNEAKSSINAAISDPMIFIASEIIESEESLSELRRARWNFTVPAYNRAGNIVVKIIDEDGFNKSINAETRLLADIARNKAVFVSLNPIFAEAEQKLQYFNCPTARGLENHKQRLLNHITTLQTRLRNETSDRLSSIRAKGLSIEEILSNPRYLEYKAQLETAIAKTKEEIEICDQLIEKANIVLLA